MIHVQAWNGRDRAWLLALGAASLAFHLAYFNHGVHNLLDLALPAVNAERILSGEVYGRDFIAPYGPLRYYLAAGAFTLFGRSLLVMNGLFLAVMTVNDLIVYRVARYLTSRGWALFAAILVTVAHGSMHKGFHPLGGLLLLWALFACLRSRGRRGAFRLGLALGGVALLRWDAGILGVGAAAVGLALLHLFPLPGERRIAGRAACRVAAGFLAPVLPAAATAVLFLRPGELLAHTLHRIQTFRWYRAEYGSWAELFQCRDLRSGLFTVLVLLLGAALLASLLAGLHRTLKRRVNGYGVCLVVLALVGFALLGPAYLVLRFNRFLYAAPPGFIALAWMLHRVGAGEGFRRRPRLIAPVAAGLFSACLLFYLWNYTGLASQDSFAVLRYEERYLAVPRARCWVRTGLARDVEEALAFIAERTRTGGGLFTGPACPLFYFLAGRSNPAPWLDWLYYYFDPEAERRMVEGLERHGVRLYVRATRSPARCTLQEACPTLDRYLRERFRLVKAGRRFLFYERR